MVLFVHSSLVLVHEACSHRGQRLPFQVVRQTITKMIGVEGALFPSLDSTPSYFKMICIPRPVLILGFSSDCYIHPTFCFYTLHFTLYLFPSIFRMSLPVLPPVIEVGKPRNFNANYVLLWNNVALDLVRLVHTLSGQQSGPPLTARALGILHLAIHDAYFAVFPYQAHEPRNMNFDDIMPYLSTAQLEQAEKMSPNPTANPITTEASRKKASKQAMNAVAGAAVTILNKLYVNPDKKNPNTSNTVTLSIAGFINAAFMSFVEANNLDLRSGGYQFGIAIAKVNLSILEIPASQPGTDAGTYMPNSNVPYYFDDDPSHPIRPRFIDPNDPEDGMKATRPYEGPFYGPTAAVFATTKDFKLADPPLDPRNPPNPLDFTNKEYQKYLESLEDVHRMGGIEELASTKRRPGQTTDALFWAYDGTNLIGTPLRLYNQILRQVAFDRRVVGENITSDQNNAEIIRLFALANTAMADAGIYCWRDKYHYELWRPLSGIRQDPMPPVPDGFARPFFKVLGAPATNSNESGFKPPFPSYPSGHATFAAAGFHTVRLFYNKRGDKVFVDNPAPPTTVQVNGEVNGHGAQPLPNPGKGGEKTADPKTLDDTISFSFISDELNGISRELYQTYDPSRSLTDKAGDVRTRRTVTFPSMKSAIFANAISRIWLGVHWHFDAFDGASISVPYVQGEAKGKDNNLPQPKQYPDIQLFAVEKDGSTAYKNVSEMDWFAAKGMRDGQGPKDHFIGGVPLGMCIAEDIARTGMRFEGSLQNLGNPVPRGSTQ